MASKVVLITGTSSGVGLSAAILFAKAGYTSVATMRDLSKATALEERAKSEGVKVDVRQLDVQDNKSIADCVASVVKDHGRIDVLVNNAGAGCVGIFEELPESELRKCFEVNFFGVWATTKAVVPVMRTQKSGHIINITSVGGIFGQPFNEAYCAAKFAVEGMTESMSALLLQHGIKVSLVEPGPINTEFVNNVSRPQSITEEPIYKACFESYIGGTKHVFATFGQTGDEVAKVIVDAAADEKPHLRYQTSEMSKGIAAKLLTDITGDSRVLMSSARLPPLPQ